MTEKYPELTSKRKEALREQLYQRDGSKCHYCGIEEKEFTDIWGKTFYGGVMRGRRLEIDHKDKDNRQSCELKDLVLACALCNMAKSDKFSHDEFKEVGNVIRTIWQRKALNKNS